jgi:membrane protein
VGPEPAVTFRQHLRLLARAAWRGVGELYNSDGLTHAASIAYYSLLSLFPFTLLMLSLVGWLTQSQGESDVLVEFVFRYFPRQFEFITGQIQAFRASTFRMGVGGVIALVWASLGVFNAVTSGVNHAWGVERRRSFLKHRLVGLLMFLSAGVFLLLALLIVSATNVVQSQWFVTLWPDLPIVSWLGGMTAGQTAMVLQIICVALVYYFIPNTKVRFRDVWPGAILVGVLWQGALSIFSWYARDLGALNVVHGSMAAVVTFLIWIYVSAVLLLYGVEMTASYARMQDAVMRHPAFDPHRSEASASTGQAVASGSAPTPSDSTVSERR